MDDDLVTGSDASAARMRCNPVVQLVVALAAYTVAGAKARSNAATFGPCVTQPLVSGSCKACHSSSPRKAKAI